MNRLTAIVTLALAACVPVPRPTALETATAAVNITDRALAAALLAADERDTQMDLAPWINRESMLRYARDTVAKGADLCTALPIIEAVAVGISCAECLAAVNSAREELSCKM